MPNNYEISQLCCDCGVVITLSLDENMSILSSREVLRYALRRTCPGKGHHIFTNVPSNMSGVLSHALLIKYSSHANHTK